MNIHLERARDSDFELIAPWLNDPENSTWLLSLYRLRKYNRIIHGMVLKKSDNLLYLVYDGDQPLGLAGLYLIDLIDKTAMLWYVLGDKSYAGQGVMTAAVNLLLEKAFIDLKLHSVQALVAEENSASQRVLEKNNFKRSGIQREAHARGDHFQNRICFDLLSPEYQKIPQETEMQEIEAKQAKQIHEIISTIKQSGKIPEHQNLLTSGFLDSFDIIRLVDELEKTFMMRIDGREITEENFQSIEAITRLVLKTRKK